MNTQTDHQYRRKKTALVEMLQAEQAILSDMENLISSDEWPELHEAIDIMHKISSENAGSRVVLTGIGKSGHVAKKVAATMASLGTPTMFIHAAEASHGDLGMLTKSDVLLAFSNSGNTMELASILDYAQRIEVPIIGITMGRDSKLAKASTIPLIMPKAREGCALGLAPTTSTIAQMALGDALSVGLSVKLNFERENFNTLHPGGALGNSTSKVSDHMITGDGIPLVNAEESASTVVWTMAQKSFSIAGIIDKTGALIGIIHAKDVDPAKNSLASTLIRTAIPVVGPNDPVATAIDLMQKYAVAACFVVEGNRPVGIMRAPL